MINKKKVRLMTRTAIYEKNTGHDDMPMAKYYKGDYVSLHMWNTAVAVTIAYLIIFFLVVACNFENVVYNLTNINYAALIAIMAVAYAAAQAIFLIAAYIVFSYKYSQSTTRIKIYQNRLHKIFMMNKEDRKKKGGTQA